MKSFTVYHFVVQEKEIKKKIFLKPKETSMMWPSQNFLLYNGIIIKIKVSEWINN